MDDRQNIFLYTFSVQCRSVLTCNYSKTSLLLLLSDPLNRCGLLLSSSWTTSNYSINHTTDYWAQYKFSVHNLFSFICSSQRVMLCFRTISKTSLSTSAQNTICLIYKVRFHLSRLFISFNSVISQKMLKWGFADIFKYF